MTVGMSLETVLETPILVQAVHTSVSVSIKAEELSQ